MQVVSTGTSFERPPFFIRNFQELLKNYNFLFFIFNNYLTSVIVVTFDMTKRDTLESAKKWLNSALNYNVGQKPLIFLAGTKADLLVN